MIVIYVILAIVGLFILMQVSLVISSRKMKGKALVGLKGNLKDLEKNGTKGLVYFYSPGCRACTSVTPVIKNLQKKYKHVFDVDVSRDYSNASVFGVKATPTTIFMENGVVKEVIIGARSPQMFEDMLKKAN
ncbi:MAG: thioredoxin family protein [Ignavibacteria bacterium]|nr:thioredoxin family protein [Ignavibacteria bacterium]